jgi:hypothetical protein
MKADKATIRARVDDILRVILDGAQPWDIRQYVSQRQAAGEPPWTIPEGGNPLSERQIRRYCDIADRWMARASRTHRRNLFRRHVARRERLYGWAVAAGQLNVALAVLRDLGEFQGLYPSADDLLRREAEALRKQLAGRKEARREGSNGQAAEGVGGPGAQGEGPP